MKDSKGSLLLVESDSALSEKIRAELEKTGFTVASAFSGDEAAAVLKNGAAYDAVLLAMQLSGGLSGPETAKEILRSKELPIIFLIDDTCSGIISRAENIPCYGYLEKKSGTALFEAGIRTALRLFKTEKRLRKEKTALDTTLDSIGDAVIETDQEGRVVRLNPAAEHICGWSFDDAFGLPAATVLKLIDGSTGMKTDNPIEQVLQTGRTQGMTENTVLLSKEGLEYRIADIASPITDAGGNISGAVMVFRDVTTEYVLQAEIKRNEENYRSIFQSVNDAIVYQDYDSGIVLDVNQRMLDMYGYGNKEEVIGFTPDMFSSGEEGYSKKEAGEHIRKAVHDGPQVFEWRAKHRSGRLFWVEVNLKITTIDGKKRICAVVRDISRRKRTEEEAKRSFDRLRIINELSSDYAYCHHLENDGSMKLVWSIGNFERITGYSPEELYASGGWARLIHPDDLGKAAEYSRNKLAGKNDTVVLRIITKNGGLRWIQDGGCPCYGEDGSIIGTYGYAKDVSDRVETEEDLRKSLQRNQELLQELQHRAKNSFFLISSLISLMEGESKDTAVSKILAEIRARVSAISDMYEMLYVSGSVEEVRLDEYLVKISGKLLITKNVNFDHECDPVSVSVQKAITVGLIYSELITNALKYAFKKDRENIFRLTLSNKGKELSIIVHDNGPGLPHELDVDTVESFGIKMIRILSKQIQAGVEFENDGGTRCTLTVPV